eukprot:3215157-Ditylum_brightwellii.AAC.1
MTEPLVDLLGYSGITKKADQILLGTAPPIDGIDEYTQLYLDQLRAVDWYLPQPAEPVPFPQHLGEVKRLREQTSSGPSDVSPTMVKTEVKDTLLAKINWQASNFPWCSGYSPCSFRTDWIY